MMGGAALVIPKIYFFSGHPECFFEYNEKKCIEGPLMNTSLAIFDTKFLSELY